jgi:hypothetical protein
MSQFSISNTPFSKKRVSTLLTILGALLLILILTITNQIFVTNRTDQQRHKNQLAEAEKQAQSQQDTPSPKPTLPPEVDNYSSNILSTDLQLTASYVVNHDKKLEVWVKSLRDPIPNPRKNNSEEQTYTTNDNVVVYTEQLNVPEVNFISSVSYAQLDVENPIAFANKKPQLAIFFPDKLVILDLAVNSKNQVSVTRTQVTPLTEIPIESKLSLRMFYTGNDQKIYLSRHSLKSKAEPASETVLYTIASKQIEKLTDVQLSYAFPMPNSASLVYGASTGVGVWSKGITHEYLYPDKADYDYLIKFSPTGEYVCTERGSSGSHWYTIYAFPSMRRVQAYTPDYSYCGDWLDGNRILITESHGYYKLLYEVDARTGKKTFLSKEKYDE